MNRLSSCLGRGLLVLALSGFAVACGDDDDGRDHDAGEDAGPTAGRAGGGAGRDGGSGRDGGAAGRDAGPPPTMAECLDAVDTATMGGVSDSCANCVCEAGPREAAACTGACWGLIQCYGAMCAEFTPGTNEGSTCATSKCAQFISGVTGAMPLGAIIRSDCSTECVATPETDAGEDAGN